MPELPEVETIVRKLAPLVASRRIDAVDVRDARWCAPLGVGELADAVLGRRVARLWRRGKYLVWELDDEVFLVMHLRMTGTLLWEPAGMVPHTRVMIAFDRGDVAFVDPRRFGTGTLLLGGAALDRYFAVRLGVEPLSDAFTGALLRGLAAGRRAPIKPFLLDQRHLAGVGNIYADEALFRAGVHPLRAAGALRPRQYGLLRDAVVAVLLAGIDARGASIDDYRDPEGVKGSFQDRFLVHRREGLPCPACGRAIRKLVVGGRGTYVCERCQPRPRPRPRRVAGVGSGREHLIEPPGARRGDDLRVAADQLAGDDHLREGHHAGALDELDPAGRVL
jgi:formamidopyrimidine-DNA glycosylase